MILELAETKTLRHVPYRFPSTSGECRVCGAPAVHRHFGSALSCNSCCAFFRRTVSSNKTYSCVAGKNCVLRFDGVNRMCKYCRLRRCLDAGMQITAVTAATSAKVSTPTDTPLKRVAVARNAIFLNRYRATATVYGGQENVPNASCGRASFESCSMAFRAEFVVLCEFLKSSGVLEYFDGDPIYVCKSVAAAFLYTWQIYENSMITVRNFGHHLRRLFCLNERYTDLNDDALEKFYRSDPRLSDWPYLVRHGMIFYGGSLDAAKKLASLRLDELEHAALTLILLVYTMRQVMQPTERCPLAPLLDGVFHELHKHYVENYEDTALRLDKLIQLSLDIQELRRIFDEHVVILKLSGKQTVLSELEATASEGKAR